MSNQRGSKVDRALAFGRARLNLALTLRTIRTALTELRKQLLQLFEQVFKAITAPGSLGTTRSLSSSGPLAAAAALPALGPFGKLGNSILNVLNLLGRGLLRLSDIALIANVACALYATDTTHNCMLQINEYAELIGQANQSTICGKRAKVVPACNGSQQP